LGERIESELNDLFIDKVPCGYETDDNIKDFFEFMGFDPELKQGENSDEKELVIGLSEG